MRKSLQTGDVGWPVASSRRLVVKPGISMLRYLSAEDVDNPPSLVIDAGRLAAAGYPPVAGPGLSANRMIAPGEVIVLRSDVETEIRVSVEVGPRCSSSAVEVRIELLSAAVRRRPTNASVERLPRPASIALPPAGRAGVPLNARIEAHVYGYGDVIAEVGEWVAGPDDPLRIEGFRVIWADMPAGLELSYSAIVGGSVRRRIAAQDAGDFVGTKNRALPLVGASFRLEGPAAGRYELSVEALFSGGSVVERVGRDLKVAGPNGIEALLGLRFVVEPVPVSEDFGDRRRFDPASISAGPDRGRGGVRVFRDNRSSRTDHSMI